MRTPLGLVAAFVVGVSLLQACGSTVSDSYVIENDPGAVEFVDGSELGIVTVTGDAVERLGIQTVAVRAVPRGLAVPSAALFVDSEGVWWVYTNPEPLTFVRAEVVVERDDVGQALLASGPAPGTEVVTVGVAEIYGIESEVGH